MNKIKKAIFSVSLLALTNQVVADEYFELFTKPAPSSFYNVDQETIANNEKIIFNGIYNQNISDHLSSGSHISVDFFDKKVSYKINKILTKEQNRTSFLGSSTNSDDNIAISQVNGEISGSLYYQGTLYKLRTTPQGNTLVIKVPSENLIDHSPSYIEYYSDDILNKNYEQYDTSVVDSASEFTVVVAYTADFVASAGNIPAYMDLLETETNASFANSGVNTSVSIVHSYQTNYQDSGNFSTDRDYFAEKSNPESKELRRLRDEHHADLMIVLTGNNYAFCGIATEIGATANTAIAFARESCATGYYSFAHEIGHLFGARHIISQDNNSIPFSYGHGYCNVTENTWRTVMAYRCPNGTGGNRNLHWSTPLVRINGEVTGTAELKNNARVLNVRANTIANFRQTPLATPNTPTAKVNGNIVSVDWSDVPRATSYKLAIKHNNGSWTDYNYSASSSFISWSNLNPGSRQFRVKACKSGTCYSPSGISNIVTNPEPAPVPLPAPNTPTASVSGNNVYVDWNDVTNADSYMVAIKFNNNAWTDYKYSANSSYISWSNVDPGSRQFRVKACKAGSCYSASVSSNIVITPHNSALPAPSTPTASVNGNTISVNWNDVPGAESYMLSIQYNNTWTDFKYSATTSSISWSNLGSGSRKYRVKACKAGVCYSSSNASNTVRN
ncbi:hypothetical protein B0W48_03170 [Pseudoalteromonas aliena]|uniref:Fibronectin type-III domain-containing protein n=1 Tax=Pseudoalteromonas aliena TaxID=247523 RepID=A0A1Q2GUT5_9GAMM|nr:M12 family metallo-peptidase [Pseudoalteromonas aliena]AQP98883.1 hypothetical protein B0W48_03170 [Pseudoalteromonas aliena]